MKDKFLKLKFLKKSEPGYILAFALIVVGILLVVSLSVSRIIAKEISFSRLVDNNRAAYFAADSGIECAQYLDNVLRDSSIGQSLILNSKNTTDINREFVDNANNYIFFASSSVLDILPNLNSVTCASDDSTYNKIFVQQGAVDSQNVGYVDNREAVIQNLNNEISSYALAGNSNHATTTFGLILKDGEISRCILIEFAKKKSDTSNITESFAITSTGYSSCNPADNSRVIRTIYRYSTD